MRASRLPAGGRNLFQEIKAKCAEVARSGKVIRKLTIGQPSGSALLSAKRAAAEAVMSNAEAMHEYQDNGSPGVPDFAKRFVQAHVGFPLKDDMAVLPIPGIKPMLGVVLKACRFEAGNSVRVGFMTKPGYPTPADQGRYMGFDGYSLPLSPENHLRFHSGEIVHGTELLMLNYPHNPSGQIATRDYWHMICGYCSVNNIRLFNDAAYIRLSHNQESCSLASVACAYKDLSWAEAFSGSKLGNFTGWRVGAIVGSPDFVGDITTIKGNEDSGFVAFAAAGVLHAVEHDQESIEDCRRTYKAKIDVLIGTLQGFGMQLAVEPGAGFFTLWKRPDGAFGRRITSAEQFNWLMVDEPKVGIAGVHFDPYIRYSVTGPVDEWIGDITAAFEKANISYELPV